MWSSPYLHLGGGGFRLPGIELPDEQWTTACEIARDLDQARLPVRDRFIKVRRRIRDALADRSLISVLRDPSGGSFTEPVSADLWNIDDEHLDRRFAVCQMNKRQPFGGSVAGPGFMLIFVTSKSLEPFVASLATSQTEDVRSTPRDAATLAPGLDLASHHPLANGAARKRSPEQERVRPILRELFPDGVPDRAVLTDVALVKRVGDAMGKDAAKKDTILRAAGRDDSAAGFPTRC